MVLPGQYLERATLVSRAVEGGAITLEGLYHRGSAGPAVLLCAPHPRLGGSMDSAVVAELAWAVTRRGHASLRFNYQGVGASEGVLAADDSLAGPKPLASLASEIADADAALRHLAECAPGCGLAVAGYSFGAAVALGLALQRPDLARVALVSPPTGLFDFSALRALERPALAIHGADDTLVDARALAAMAGGQTTVRTLPGSDHVFTRGLTELGRLVSEWLDER